MTLLLSLSACARPTTTRPASAQTKPGEQVPSEDALIPDFHSLGLVAGKTCA